MITRFVTLLFKRSYSILLLSFFSLLIGGFLFGVVLSFTKSANDYLIKEGKVLSGGDIILTSPYPIPTDSPLLISLKDKGGIFSLGKNIQVVFTTSSLDKAKPASVRIVSDQFPLYGEVLLEDGKEFLKKEKGLYAEKIFLERLGVEVGDSIKLGTSTFTILGVLLKEPDAVSVGISFNPKVIIFEDDFRNVAIDLSQSRVQYKLYIRENSESPLTSANIREIEQYAKDNKMRFDNAVDGPNNLIRGLSSVDKFIGIVLSIALFLVVINIIANLVYVLARFRKTIALLKVFGATKKEIDRIFILLLGIIGGTAGGLGAYVGALLTALGIGVASEYLEVAIVMINPLYVAAFGAIFGIVFIIISALPFLRSLKKIQPKELLLNQSSSHGKGWKQAGLLDALYYVPIPLSLIALLYAVSSDIYLAVISVVVCGALFIMFMTITFFVIQFLYQRREKFSFMSRSILSFLHLRKFETLVTTASIMTAFCGVFIVATVERNIITNLARNVSTSAPSMYLIDISKSQLPQVKEIVGETFTEYPIVRGRLLTLNGRNISELDSPGLRREFNMTYRDALITGEKVVAGDFGVAADAVTPSVSIDKEFGDELGGVRIGDTLEVFVQGMTVTATITSIREVDSTSGIPFFYLVFPTSVLSKFPGSYFGTAQVDTEKKKSIEQELGVLFPNIIPIDTKAVIEQLTDLLSKVVTIVSLVGIPSILLGILLVIVMLYQSLYERSGDVLILRAFGYTKRKVTLLFIWESGTLAILSGVIAYIVAHIIAYVLNVYIFSFELFSFSTLPLYIILGNIVLVSLFSFVLSYTLVRAPLKKLLAEK